MTLRLLDWYQKAQGRLMILAIREYKTRDDFMAIYDLNCAVRSVYDEINAAISCVALGHHERLRTEIRRQHVLRLGGNTQTWTADDDYNLVLAVQCARTSYAAYPT